MEEEVILIARFDTPFEAEEARIALEEEEIECMIADELTGNLGLVGWSGPGGVKLFVRAEDAERAAVALAGTPARKNLVVEPPEDAGTAATGQEA
ncbi:MAG: DUF2007 domain-containing protein [Planctomycetes bacterium]|nr:DUF2007 domain-containing protein [Planctomycetota bacterium]